MLQKSKKNISVVYYRTVNFFFNVFRNENVKVIRNKRIKALEKNQIFR